MKISTRGRYALRFMIEIAKNSPNKYKALKDISEHENISIKYLEQIASILTKQNLVKSTRGPQGGYCLTKKPEKYTIGEILEITEGSLAPVSCLETDKNECERNEFCPTLPFWKGLHTVITDYLNHYTLANLIEETKQNTDNK